MKNNYIKYIFIVFVVILIIFAIYKIQKDEKKNSSNQEISQSEDEKQVANDIRVPIVNYDSINPILSNNLNVQDISRLVFEPLLTMDENYKLQPCLATEWSISGETSYVIKLRENVKWQDGSKFTASDVKFTIDQLKSISSIYSSNVQHVTQVDIVDDYALKITLDEKDANFGYKLTFPILSNNFYLEQDFQTTEKNNTPMGTGMYKITSNEGGVILLKKNQNWWNISQKDTRIQEIKVNLYGSMGDAYNAFKMGNLDILTTQSTDLEKYIGTIGYNKVEYKGREYDFLAINCNNEILNNVNVRKAINFSIDKNNIIASVFNGKYASIDFPLDFGMWLYDTNDSSSGYNIEQAKQVLIDDGWEFKNGSWQKTNNYKVTKLNFTLTVNNNNEERMKAAEIIKNNLESLGIKIKISYVPQNTYLNILEKKNYDLILAGTNIGLTADLSTYFGENNIANYKNQEVSTIMNDLKNITDENLIKDKYKRLIELYKEECPYKSLYINQKTLIYSSNLKGSITPNSYNIFYNIENWYREI